MAEECRRAICAECCHCQYEGATVNGSWLFGALTLEEWWCVARDNSHPVTGDRVRCGEANEGYCSFFDPKGGE